MLDIKFIRENPAAARAGIGRKGFDTGLIDQILAKDAEVRALKGSTETLRAEQKNKSKQFGELKKTGGDVTALQGEIAAVKDGIAAGEAKLTAVEEEIQGILDIVPNIPHASVPDGRSAEDNKIAKSWGEPPVGMKAAAHYDIGKKYGFEQDRGSAMSGAGFLMNIGPLARLERSLINFFVDFLTSKRGYTECWAPFMVRRPAMYGTGYLPKGEGEQYYSDRDELYLIPTAEVPLTAIHAGEILAEDQLPRMYCAFTPCFRREAGAAGADTRGMVRVHQFSKVEMMQVAHPAKSYEAHEELTRSAEMILETLGLAYRRLLLCSGDMSFSAAKCYDLEVYAAGVGRWLEVSSCSNFEAFQARRSKLKYKDSTTKANEFCHTLNGSGLACPRIMVAILENFQQPDGSVKLPECLHQYYGKATL